MKRTIIYSMKALHPFFVDMVKKILLYTEEWDCLKGSVKLYGVPRGGIPVAYELLKHLDDRFSITFELKEANIIVDDILDSGRTRERILKSSGLDQGAFFVLIDKPATSIGDWYIFPWENSPFPEVGDDSAFDAVTRCLQFIGEDVNREGLLETPRRVVKAWKKIYEGYGQDPAQILEKRFTESGAGVVTLKNIEFFSTCEHHMIPFYGRASIAYKPQGQIVGLSKLARLVDCFARRLQVQERMTDQIADAIMTNLSPLAVGVVVEARHLCMMARGVEKYDPATITTSFRGHESLENEIRRHL